MVQKYTVLPRYRNDYYVNSEFWNSHKKSDVEIEFSIGKRKD